MREMVNLRGASASYETKTDLQNQVGNLKI